MASLDELLSGESQTVEYKVRRSSSAKGYLKSVVAFANARGGTLVFGVDDKTREVVGIPAGEVFFEMDAIANAIMDSIEPQALPEITIRTVDGKSLILVDVPAGRQCPYFIKADGIEAGTYVRVGATSRHADLNWVRELTQECAPEGFDRLVRRGATVSDEQVNALCERMYEVALSHADVERRDALRKLTKSQLLTWGVLKEQDGEALPTNAFAYLHGAVVVTATDDKPITATDEQPIGQSSDNKPSDMTDRQPIATDIQPMTTDRESQIVSYLANQGPSGVAEIADLLGLSKDRTRAILRGLTERGLIRKLGDKRYTRYVVTGDAR
jgi:predicted HTH transcriptional regulator